MTPGSTPTTSRRWLVLGVGLLAQASTCYFLYGLAMIAPALRERWSLSLATVGVVCSAGVFGLLAGLVLWGIAADRIGERQVMALGLTLAAAALVLASRQYSLGGLVTMLAVAGFCAASVNAASGRAVLGWFSPAERGLAMALRQTGQPLGIGIAAISMVRVESRWGLGGVCAVAATGCLFSAVLVSVLARNPPAPEVPATSIASRGGSPYREPEIWRVHTAAALLVVPQIVMLTFSVEFLVGHAGWSTASAGLLMFGVQVVGIVGRIWIGWHSDRVGSRVVPMRRVALALAVAAGALTLSSAVRGPLVPALVFVACVLSMLPTGLGVTAAAELGGMAWSGRVIGIHNTAQNTVAVLTPPVFGLVAGTTSYGVGFVLLLVASAAAAPVLPTRRPKAVLQEVQP